MIKKFGSTTPIVIKTKGVDKDGNEVNFWETKFTMDDCSDDEISYWESNEEYFHDDDTSFYYKYVVTRYWLYDDKKYCYTLEMVVSPKSLCDDYVKDMAYSFGWDFKPLNEVREMISFSDIVSNGGASVTFESETYDEEKDDEVLNVISNMLDCVDSLRGFSLDKVWNMIGSTGWDVIDHCVNNEPLFKMFNA